MNRTVTALEVLGLNTCYKPDKIHEIASRREVWTLVDILDQSDVPTTDRIWVVVRLMPPADTRAFARWCALQVVHLWGCPDVVRKWLETGDESIQSEAVAAATAAADAYADAYAADAYAAYAAADAAYAAADAAYAAAYADAAADACAAASAAAYAAAAAAAAAARETQIEKLKEMCQ